MQEGHNLGKRFDSFLKFEYERLSGGFWNNHTIVRAVNLCLYQFFPPRPSGKDRLKCLD